MLKLPQDEGRVEREGHCGTKTHLDGILLSVCCDTALEGRVRGREAAVISAALPLTNPLGIATLVS